MAYGPCKNSNCNSYGKPHPNCKCYGEMAEGGEVSNFCDSSKPHEKGCEYYAEGGEVDFTEPADPMHSVSGFLATHGLHGLIEMNSKQDLPSYMKSIRKGHKSIDLAVDGLFDGKGLEPKDHGKSHQKIDDWMSKGGATNDIQQEVYNHEQPVQAFAEGGQVDKPSKGIIHDHPVADAYPEHNILLQTAKGRMSNYLNSLKGQKNAPRLAFDDEPIQPFQKKSYKRAVAMAAHPLSIMDKIKNGTIEPEHVKHLNALHPEVNETLQKRLTERIIEAQLNGKKPSRTVRQALSLFIGAPLSGELSPENIRAAQATYINNQQGSQAQQAGSAGKKQRSPGNKSALSKSSQAFLTSNEAAVSRQQKQ